MKKAVIYIHGKGGNIQEADHYRPLFGGCDVIGFDYKAQTPWDAKAEFTEYFSAVCGRYDTVELIAGSIGAFFAMNAVPEARITKAYFISPVTDMERLISDMMQWADVSVDRLRAEKEIATSFGETLSWDYLCYIRENPLSWTVPTHILYGGRDTLIPFETVSDFARRTGSTLTVMHSGEHWFHTEEQMRFLDEWILHYVN